MAYSTTAPLKMLLDFTSDAPRTFFYASTHNSTDITATGFFTGCGAASRGSGNVRANLGDIVIARASTDATVPGRVTTHSVIGSSANFATTSASSAYNTAFDLTVSST